ncbi:hypothetical protein [Thermospira aquatica]|uniref:Uncharacterized protein n=1 Tax=Thermospira aquatica TaxID=2828656 RepID=A0AAX3BFL2_9SPIR|nr:hypothetical protein [Thermospira aquatica]URA11036.1 hypothetical protein KDW03_04335 [Thermospira aquatica]
MGNWWDRVWFWVTVGLGGLAFLTILAFLLPVLFFLALPFVFLGVLWWLLESWNRLTRKERSYDETGARYTEATIISKETVPPSLSQGKENGQDTQSST